MMVNESSDSSQSEQYNPKNDYTNTLVKSTLKKTDYTWVRKTLWTYYQKSLKES